MKSILLKLDDELFNEVEESAKELKTTKTGFIKKALEETIKLYKRKQLEKQIAREVAIIKADKETWEEMKIFEEASLIDLSKFLEDEDDYK
jgi:metal-responsive CopG/Arc/MetJ family transcriptional regulator